MKVVSVKWDDETIHKQECSILDQHRELLFKSSLFKDYKSYHSLHDEIFFLHSDYVARIFFFFYGFCSFHSVHHKILFQSQSLLCRNNNMAILERLSTTYILKCSCGEFPIQPQVHQGRQTLMLWNPVQSVFQFIPKELIGCCFVHRGIFMFQLCICLSEGKEYKDIPCHFYLHYRKAQIRV